MEGFLGNDVWVMRKKEGGGGGDGGKDKKKNHRLTRSGKIKRKRFPDTSLPPSPPPSLLPSLPPSLGCTWQPEFGSWMVESTPNRPYGSYANDLLR